MLRLLAISDLHYGAGHFFRQEGRDPEFVSLAETIQQSLGETFLEQGIDCLVVAGDIFSEQQDDDLGIARDELRRLIEILDPTQTVAVPGNHDLTWQDQFSEDRQYYFKRLVEDLSDLNVRAAVDGRPTIVELVQEGDPPVALLLMDSCRLENRTMAGLGRIGDVQLAAIERVLSDANISSRTHRIVAVLHHHLLPITTTQLPRGGDPLEGPFPRISLTVDAVEILRRLSLLGIGLVIHGHQHHRAILEFRNNTWQSQPPAIHVAACGSCGATGLRRQFFAIDVVEDSALFTSYAQHPDYDASFIREAELHPVAVPFAL